MTVEETFGHFSGLGYTFANFFWMLTLDSFLHFVEEVRNRPWIHYIL